MVAIRKILIANRGEIAVRIIRTCRKMNIAAGAVFAEDDVDSLHVRMAGESFLLSGAELKDTYLNIEKLIGIAKENQFDAIHPGYGFLSESPDFARTCRQSNIMFIGPNPEVIALMGDKITSKRLAEQANVPVLEPLTGRVEDLARGPDKYDFPVLVKADAGGGGKGMRLVADPKDLKNALISTSREAKSYFGDERVFVEKYIRDPRHIEVQVLGDNYGNAVALFERECTLQRRHQKVIEEAPSPTLGAEKRRELLRLALSMTKASGYTNAGTIEFLADGNLNFYFLEMNTRIQVEHPVTEMITGIDIVEEQIKIAAGEKLAWRQEDLEINGHAIECRIYAEDPENNFAPAPGKIHYYREPCHAEIRVDAAIAGPAEISGRYDPMIAKLIARGKNRNEAIKNMDRALTSFHIHGLTTNIAFQRNLINHTAFRGNKITTHFIEENLDKILVSDKKRTATDLAFILAAFTLFYKKVNAKPRNVWEEIGFWRIHDGFTFEINSKKTHVVAKWAGDRMLLLNMKNHKFKIHLLKSEGNNVVLQVNDKVYEAEISKNHLHQYFISFDGNIYKTDRDDNLLTQSFINKHKRQGAGHNGVVVAPMPGKILDVYIKEGDVVVKDQRLITLEAMKMENLVVAPFDGIAEKILVMENYNVDAGERLIIIKPK